MISCGGRCIEAGELGSRVNIDVLFLYSIPVCSWANPSNLNTLKWWKPKLSHPI